jgi:cell division protein FtsB
MTSSGGNKLMVSNKTAALCLICVSLLGGVIGTVMTLNQKVSELQTKTNQIVELGTEKVMLEQQVFTLETNISSIQSKATTLNKEKTSLETETSSLQNKIDALENENNMLETEISSLQNNVSSLKSEIISLENDKTSLKTQVSSLQTEVEFLEDEMVQSFNSGYSEGTDEGYQLGFDEGYMQGVEELKQNGWYLRDPTYEEAIAFVNLDETDKNQYNPTYVCYDFTADFNHNALQAGYRCGFVYIEFSDCAHAIACFDTTDQGTIYIEPQTDEIVTLEIGQPYVGHNIENWGIIW